MNLSDLLGASVFDRDGVDLGRVRDVRLVQDGPVQGTFGAGLRLQGLIVGPVAVSSRLGYGRLGVDRPWLVAAVAHRLNRDSRYVAWADVVRLGDRRIEVDRRAGELHPPIPLPQLRGAR